MSIIHAYSQRRYHWPVIPSEGHTQLLALAWTVSLRVVHEMLI